jgi:HSP20 family protein
MNTVTTQQSPSTATRAEPMRSGRMFTPRVDIYETEKELLLFAELPGVRPEDVELHYEQGELTLHGKVRPPANAPAYLLQEYQAGDFYRAFRINETIDAGKIQAECKNGILTLHLPKAEVARPRKIPITGG